MRKIVTFISMVLICICGSAQTIDPVLLEEMGQRRDNEKIRVFVIMRQQYDQQQLNRRAAHFTTRSSRREFVVNELKQFAEASQYDLRHTLADLRRGDLVSEPKVLWIANALFFEATRDAILSLADRPDIMVIGIDEERNWLPDGEESQPADPTREITSNVTQVNADQVWNLGYTGQGVVVAVIDTGVNYNHLDLADHLWGGGPEFPHHGYDVYNDDNDPIDDHGHGTHCAGTVCGDGTAGSQTGMAPDATLMCVKCLNSSGRCNDSHVISAMQWAVEHGCDVISMSLGGHGHSPAEQTLERNTCVNVLNAGVIASIAAGNEGDALAQYPIPDNVGLPGGCPPPYLDPEQEQNPGGLSCSVCVGAVDSDDQAAYFTSHGPRNWSNSDYADYPYTPGSLTEFGLIRPDVCAPGVSIKSADFGSNNGYSIMSGTSMATPCVAGCMALMLSKNVNTTPADVCRILEETAVPMSTGKSNIYGYGRVDVLAAVNAVYSGPLTLESYEVNDELGNNDGKLNAGETVSIDISLKNDSDVALDGASLVFSSESEYVTITNGTATLPHFDAGQTQTLENLFSFSLNDNAPAKKSIHFVVETFADGDSLGLFKFGVMVYGSMLRFVEVTVLNDDNNNGSLEAGETADLHVIISNDGNEPATSVMGWLSSSEQSLTINSTAQSFGDMNVNEQVSADFSVSLASNVPETYTIPLELNLIEDNGSQSNLEFELWRKAITLSSNPVEAGSLSGGGYFGPGQTCRITATPNENYVFVSWTLDDVVVSYFPSYTFTVTDEVEYVANFQEVVNGVAIGNGTGVYAILPSYSRRSYSLSQQIYTADEIGMESGEISSVAFFNTGETNYRIFSVYMINTDKTVFENRNDWIPVTENDKVFSGNVTMTKGGWTTIYFNTPFVYDGFSNIVLVVDDNTGSAVFDDLRCRISLADGNQAIFIYGNDLDFDPCNLSDYTGSLIWEKNQIIFGVPQYEYTVTAVANPAEGGTVDGGGDIYFYGQPITVTATPNEGYVFRHWTKNGEVVSCLSSYTFPVTENINIEANFVQISDGIAIGNATSNNQYLPSFSWCYYTLTQQIYTSEEMGGEACNISSVSFFNTRLSGTRDYKIYMVNTDKAYFENDNDWIVVTEADQVFSGSVTFSIRDWTTIYFNVPFVYDGSSNLALIVDDNTVKQTTHHNCRTFGTIENQSLYASGFNSNYDPFNPSDITGTRLSEKNDVVFGKMSLDYTINVSVNPEEGGSVSGGGGSCYFGQPITLVATANEGYVFNSWMKNGEVVSFYPTYSFSVIENADIVANFQSIGNGVVVGDGAMSTDYLPSYSRSGYTLSQQIYTADEINKEACEISNVSFFNILQSYPRDYRIYMVNTDKSSFENDSDWITVSESDLVFSGSIALNKGCWTTIQFNSPFEYDGTSNIALIVDDNTTSYWYAPGGIKCRTFSTSTNQAICINNEVSDNNTNYDPYNPSSYIGLLMSEKNQILFDWSYSITTTASPIEGGTVNGCGNYGVGTTCTITATPNAGYYFLNWTENGEEVSYDAAYSFIVDGDRNLVANFVEGESICTISFDLFDSSNNGWSGNYLVVDYGNGNSEQLTVENGGSASFSREVATGSTIALSWIAGTNTYQCSFDIKFENGVLIYQSSSLSSSFQQDLNINCAVATAPRTITAVANPIEGGTVEGAGTYESGTLATMTATPNAGYGFCFWSENGQQVSTDASYSFLVSSDRNLVARFSLPLTVTVTTNMASGGTATGAGTYYYGNTCTLTATPNEGYLFLNWSKNGEVVSCNATYNLTVTEDTEIEAVFMRLEGTLIGQGESTNSYLPSCSYWNYTMSQQIYTPNEIGGAGNITSISYYNGGTTKTRTYNIYMVHTDKIAFSGSTDWIAVTEADRVYSGSVNMAKGYWNTIVLDTPFAYDGTSNLAVIVDDNTGSWSSGMACRVFSAQSSQAIYIYSDDTNYDPYNPSSYSGTRSYVKNQIILGFMTSTAQTIELSEGWNWISTYVDLNEVDGIVMLEAALGDYGVTIQTNNESADYFGGGEWVGLEDYEWTNAEMVMVEVTEDCTITLAGPTVAPGTVEIEINPGWNWIGFPLSTETAIGVAMGGFEPEEEDAIQSNVEGTSDYLGEWIGDVLTLVPGQGYMYYSNSTEPKTLIFSTTGKGKGVFLRKRKE